VLARELRTRDTSCPRRADARASYSRQEFDEVRSSRQDLTSIAGVEASFPRAICRVYSARARASCSRLAHRAAVCDRAGSSYRRLAVFHCSPHTGLAGATVANSLITVRSLREGLVLATPGYTACRTDRAGAGASYRQPTHHALVITTPAQGPCRRDSSMLTFARPRPREGFVITRVATSPSPLSFLESFMPARGPRRCDNRS